jgi:hypothetical protein
MNGERLFAFTVRQIGEQFSMHDQPVSFSSRVLSAAMGSALTCIAVWIALRNLARPTWDGWIFWVPLTLFLLTVSILCWWFALQGQDPESRAIIRSSWSGGRWVGGISFVIGFIGPLIVTPKANLGPLLGILITGPLGFVVGALGAFLVRKRRASH